MAEVSKSILDKINADGKKEEEYEETIIPRPDVMDGSELYKVRVRFTSPVLGSKPMRRDLFERILMPRNPHPDTDIEDLQMLNYGIYMAQDLLDRSKEKLDDSFIDPKINPERDSKDVSDDDVDDGSWFNSLVAGMTGFLCDSSGNPYFDSYIPTALMKYAWKVRKQHPNALSTAMKQGKSVITAHLYVTGMEPERPYKIRLNIPKFKRADILSRPLHVETRQGPRQALATSVVLPADTWFEFKIKVLAPKLVSPEIIHEWLSYGEYQGFGQFRGGRYGTFDYTLSRLSKR